jgi:hypothetical protein
MGCVCMCMERWACVRFLYISCLALCTARMLGNFLPNILPIECWVIFCPTFYPTLGNYATAKFVGYFLPNSCCIVSQRWVKYTVSIIFYSTFSYDTVEVPRRNVLCQSTSSCPIASWEFVNWRRYLNSFFFFYWKISTFIEIAHMLIVNRLQFQFLRFLFHRNRLGKTLWQFENLKILK